MKDLTLVIMAAGMGSRFGGLKQVEPVGPNGEFIIDYSIYDAIKTGFNKVVFIIKEENYELFRATIGQRIEKKIKTEYCFQALDNLPAGYEAPKDRVKPWGTAHAILAAKDVVKENFAIINADDFYSREPYRLISEFFAENKNVDFVIPPYQLGETLAENGAVKRGVCQIKNDYLTSIIESSVERKNGEIEANPLDDRPPFKVEGTDLVSLNIFGFTPRLFAILENDFVSWLEQNKDDLTSAEYLLPDVIEANINKNNIAVKVLANHGKWYGITYKEDKALLAEKIEGLIQTGDYPNNLWQ